MVKRGGDKSETEEVFLHGVGIDVGGKLSLHKRWCDRNYWTDGNTDYNACVRKI